MSCLLIPEYANYKAALDASKLAENTSNIETCEDDRADSQQTKNTNRKPAKLLCDDSDTDAGNFF